MRLLSLLTLILSSFLAKAHYAPVAEDVLALPTDQDGAGIDAKEVPVCTLHTTSTNILNFNA